MSRSRRLIALGMLLTALLHTGLWLNAQWCPVRTIAIALPIAPAHQLHVHVWKPVKDNTSWGFGGALAHEIDRPLTVMVWYNDIQATSMTRLVTMRAPTWPLLSMALLLGLSAVLLYCLPGKRQDVLLLAPRHQE
jgi:hypothetical protein